MKLIHTGLGVGIFLAVFAANADEKLPLLKSGDNVYSNVTVTSVTATDIYFTYSGGIGNAKLKNLDRELQKHFHFDAAKAGAAEKSQADATAQFKRNLQAKKSDAGQKLPAATYDNGDVVVPEIFAQSFRGQRPPSIYIDDWVTAPPPDPNGKFVLVFFWTTAAEQCRNAIPHLDDLASQFRDRLTVIGLSNQPKEEMLKMKSPLVNFFVGTDTQSRSLQAFGVTMIPHAVLIDPAGIVRFEGAPVYLGAKDLAHLLDTYAP
jgi:cytochrome c biogenesis protein CcmG/thiol:disulfide interchange protein DsbE